MQELLLVLQLNIGMDKLYLTNLSANKKVTQRTLQDGSKEYYSDMLLK